MIDPLERRRLLAAPPTADAGGPYSIYERASLTLNGASRGDIIKWEWDLKYSAATGFQVDRTGRNPILDGDLLDGPSSFTIALRVTDDKNRTDLDTANVTVFNDAPQAFLHTSGAAYPGEPVTISIDHPDDSQPDIAAGFTYAFDLDNNGTFETDAGRSSSVLAPDWMTRTPGRYDIRGRITDKDGASSIESFYVLIHPPYVSLLDRTLVEGNSITLQVGYSAGTDLSFAWDLAYDGVTFDPQATGTYTLFDSWGIDGPGERIVAVRATDRFGNSSIASAKITITNAPPQLYVSMPDSVQEGGVAYIYTLAYEYSPQDRQVLRREFDFNNDGVPDATLDSGYGAYMPIPSEFVADGPGSRQLRIRAVDDDGGYVDSIHSIAITNAAPSGSVAVSPTDVGVPTTVRVTDLHDPSIADLAALRFSYDFDNDNVWDVADSALAEATIPASYLTTAGSRTVRVRIADKDGAAVIRTASFNVSPGTTASIAAEAMTVMEGSTTSTLSATYTISSFATVSSLAWDFDYDGVTFHADGSGATVSLPPLDGFSQRTVAFRVIDSAGAAALDTMTLNVLNVAPRANAQTWQSTVPEGTTGASVRLDGLVDPGPGDLAGLRFSFDFNNDGAFDVVESASNEATVPASLLADGPASITVRARVADDDGAFNDYLMPMGVTNVRPTITLTHPSSVKVGEPFTLGVAVSDVGLETISSIVIDWRDGTTTTLPPGVFTATRTFAGQQGTRTLEVNVTDEDGVSSTKTLFLLDAPPTVARSFFLVEADGTGTTPSIRGPVLTVSLSENVAGSLSSDDLIITNLTTGQILPTAAGTPRLTFTHAQNSASWRWAGALPDGEYRATLPAGSIVDVNGTPMASDVHIDFFVLGGDANRDRKVDFADLLILNQNYGLGGRRFSQGNFDYSSDGYVGFEDLLLLSQRYGGSLLQARPIELAASEPKAKARRAAASI